MVGGGYKTVERILNFNPPPLPEIVNDWPFSRENSTFMSSWSVKFLLLAPRLSQACSQAWVSGVAKLP